MFSLRGKRGTGQFEIFVVSMKFMAVFATESSFAPCAILFHFISIILIYSALITMPLLSMSQAAAGGPPSRTSRPFR